MANHLDSFIYQETEMHSEIFNNYIAKDKSNLIGLLQDIQSIYGYLPEPALLDISEFLGLPVSRIYGVATFYNQFRLKPLGKHIIRVCRGTACHVKNSANILFALETTLGVKAGETTRDKNFTLETVVCIGACSIAPVINVDSDYYGRVEVKDITRILKKYSQENVIEKKEKQVEGEK